MNIEKMDIMEQLELKYDSRFVVQELEKLIPEEAKGMERIQQMTEEFKNTLIQTDAWDKKRLYLLLMFIHHFEPIKIHILSHSNQHTKWKYLLNDHLPGMVKKHLNFEYNAMELVTEALNLLFII